MASCYIFIHMNVNELKPKIHLMKFQVYVLIKTFENECQLHPKDSFLQKTIKMTHITKIF